MKNSHCNTFQIEDLFNQYDYAWEPYLHCPCHICELKRKEENVTKCIDKTCQGCKNIASGKKVKKWNDDILKG